MKIMRGKGFYLIKKKSVSSIRRGRPRKEDSDLISTIVFPRDQHTPKSLMSLYRELILRPLTPKGGGKRESSAAHL